MEIFRCLRENLSPSSKRSPNVSGLKRRMFFQRIICSTFATSLQKYRLMLRRKPLIDADWLLGPEFESHSRNDYRWLRLVGVLSSAAILVFGWSAFSKSLLHPAANRSNEVALDQDSQGIEAALEPLRNSLPKSVPDLVAIAVDHPYKPLAQAAFQILKSNSQFTSELTQATDIDLCLSQKSFDSRPNNPEILASLLSDRCMQLQQLPASVAPADVARLLRKYRNELDGRTSTSEVGLKSASASLAARNPTTVTQVENQDDAVATFAFSATARSFNQSRSAKPVATYSPSVSRAQAGEEELATELAMSSENYREIDRSNIASPTAKMPANALRQSSVAVSSQALTLPDVNALVSEDLDRALNFQSSDQLPLAGNWLTPIALEPPLDLLAAQVKEKSPSESDLSEKRYDASNAYPDEAASANIQSQRDQESIAEEVVGSIAGGRRIALSDRPSETKSIRTVAYSVPRTYVPSREFADRTDENVLVAQENATLAGLAEIPTGDLVRMLGSVQTRIAGAAIGELQRRGMTDEQLKLAVQLNVGSSTDRTLALDRLMANERFSPVPWLAWMAQDNDLVVREHAIRLLGSVSNDHARRELRLLLNRETNPTLQKLIRQLSFGSGNIQNSR